MIKIKSHSFKLLFIYYLLLHINCLAQQKILQAIPAKGTDTSAFVPMGYSILLTKQGDLNSDKKDDIIMVLKNNEKDKKTEKDVAAGYKRILVILFKNDSGYTLAAKTDQLVLCDTCGFETEPLNEYSLQIEKGVFTLIQSGGSTQQWVSRRKFRYQKDNFFMIGMTDEQTSHYMNVAPCDEVSPGSTYSDINLVTGERIVKEISFDCKTINKHDKIKVKPLIKLSNVNLNASY